MVELWGNVGFLVFSVSILVFTFIYLTMSRWYTSFLGTILAVFTSGVLVLCVYICLRVWGIDLPGVEWLRLILFWILGLSMLGSVVGFLEVQFGKRGEKLRQRLSRRYKDLNE